jgi:hypothetical protein
MWVALLPCGTPALPQETAPPPQKKASPANDIFSGTVSELTADSVTVLRRTPAGASTFRLDAQTRVEGNLRLKARVTVRYETGEDGQLHALHIIVR